MYLGLDHRDRNRWTVYDGANPYADFDDNGELTTRYLNGRAMDQRFARYDVDAEETAFYLTDVINSVRLIADAEGNVLYEADYTAFGMIASQSGTGGDRFTYTGRELDGTGDYYYRARYFGAGVGRFLSEDPIGFKAGDPNLYRYVGNRVTFLNDPSGNQWSWPDAVIGAIANGEIGAIGGGAGGGVVIGPAGGLAGAALGGMLGGIWGIFSGGFGLSRRSQFVGAMVCACVGVGGAWWMLPAGGGAAVSGGAALTPSAIESLNALWVILARQFVEAQKRGDCGKAEDLARQMIEIQNRLGPHFRYR